MKNLNIEFIIGLAFLLVALIIFIGTAICNGYPIDTAVFNRAYLITTLNCIGLISTIIGTVLIAYSDM